MAPVTRQKQQSGGARTTTPPPSVAGGGGKRCCKWWLYICVILVLALAITVVSSYVLKMEREGGQGDAGAHKTAPLGVDKPALAVGPGAGGDAGPESPAAQAGAPGASVAGEPKRREIKTQVPVIGVLSQVLRDYKRFTREHHLHIAASYVKWLEAAGAQVVPILLNQNDFYYEQMFRQTNGLLLPGGDNLLDPNKSTPMMVAARKLYQLAVRANDAGHHYPIWGTCLGLELLSVLSSNRNVLDSCSAIDDPLTMDFVARGKLFAPEPYANLPELGADFAHVITNILKQRKLTYNFHHKCLTDAGLARAGLTHFYKPLAYSRSAEGIKFIAIMEAFEYPFFGVQFHPEKPPFEFVVKSHQHNVPHSRQAIAVSRYFADFFVQQAQLNDHTVDRTLIERHLIYAHAPMYTAPLHDMYEQRYLFPFGSDLGASTTEEFIEHLVADDELVPENVGGAPAASAILDLPNASDSLPQRDFYILANATGAPEPANTSASANVNANANATAHM